MSRDPLRSAAADELRWYFRWSAADMGFRAQRYGGGSGKRTADRQPDKTTDSQLHAASKHRRIGEGLARLSPEALSVLRAGIVPRRQMAQIAATFGDLQELALRTKAARSGHAREAGKVTPEGWLADKCGRRDPVVTVVRKQAETMLAEAIAAYEAVRVPPPKGHREPESVPKVTRGPYRKRGRLEEAKEEADEWTRCGL